MMSTCGTEGGTTGGWAGVTQVLAERDTGAPAQQLPGSSRSRTALPAASASSRAAGAGGLPSLISSGRSHRTHREEASGVQREDIQAKGVA